MKELKINVPDGYEIDENKSTFENIIFREVCDINTMDDVYKLNGTTKEKFYRKWANFESHEIATAQEKLIVAAYNKGEKLDWNNGDQRKYYPWFNMSDFSLRGCGYVFGISPASTHLCFVREEDCIEAVEKFIDIYRESRLG